MFCVALTYMLYSESHFRKSNWKTPNFAQFQNITRIWQVCGQRWVTILRFVFFFSHDVYCSNIYWYVLISWTLLENWAKVFQVFVDVPSVPVWSCRRLKRSFSTSGGEMLLFEGDENLKTGKTFQYQPYQPTNRKGFSIAGRSSLIFQSQEMMAKRVKKVCGCSLFSDGDLWKVRAVVSPSQRVHFLVQEYDFISRVDQ